MTFSPELRQSIIIQVQKGKQYREIAKELNISVGSITNTIKNHHKKRSSSKQRVSNEDISDVSENATLSTDFNMNNSAGSPSSARIGDGKVAISTRSEAKQSSSLHIVSTSDLIEIDFADTAYQDFYPYLEVDVSQKVINAPLDSTKPESEAIEGILSSKEIESQTKNSLFIERYQVHGKP